MNKSMPQSLQQPIFVENIITEVIEKIKGVEQPEDLIVVRPDYSKPVGFPDNLYVTELYLGLSSIPPTERVVRISNQLHTNQNPDVEDTKVVVFETKPGSAISNRILVQYQPVAVMAVKEHLVCNFGFRDETRLPGDIADFLLNGTIVPK